MREHDRETEFARAVVAEALSWVGTPYRHQASRKGVGCDCLGLLRGVWRAVLGCEPQDPGPYTADWAETGRQDLLMQAAHLHCRPRSLDDLAAGNIILLRWRPHLPAKHVGILTGPERFVHAYQGNAVLVSALVPQWRQRIAGIFALPLPNTD